MIRLLIVDDSALMRRLLAELFGAAGDFILATARDGVEALAMAHEFQPDVVTLDITMPRMDGLACLDRLMIERPCPVVMLSALTQAGAETTLEALARGAVDFCPKPAGAISLAMDELASRLIATVRQAARARPRTAHRLRERLRRQRDALPSAPAPAAETGPVVLIGASTGGPPALDAVLAPLPAEFPWPIVVAQHMPARFTGPLAQRLDRLCALAVVEVTEPMRLRPGRVLIARGDADIIVSARAGQAVVLPAPASPAHRWHPSVDRLATTALEQLGARALVGVLLTGMGNDGAAAMARIHAGRGRTIAEAESSAVVWGMPGALVAAGGAGEVLPVEAIADRLLGWADARHLA